MIRPKPRSPAVPASMSVPAAVNPSGPQKKSILCVWTITSKWRLPAEKYTAKKPSGHLQTAFTFKRLRAGRTPSRQKDAFHSEASCHGFHRHCVKRGAIASSGVLVPLPRARRARGRSLRRKAPERPSLWPPHSAFGRTTGPAVRSTAQVTAGPGAA